MRGRTPSLRGAAPLAGSVAIAWLVGMLSAVAPAAVAEGKVTVEKVEYKGWKNNIKLSNGQAELIVTLDVGPRILSYRLADGENVLKQYDDQLGQGGESTWMIRGGHRLWTSPEDTTRTYAPDNAPVAHQALPGGGVRVTPPPDGFGTQKEMDITLDAEGTGVTVVHRIKNVGTQATEVAIWALTVVKPGGVEIIPLAPKQPHPGGPANARGPEDFAPNLELILWPYFDFADPRWSFGQKFITLRQGKAGPTKLGLSHKVGWVGYLNGGTLFVKRFSYQPGQTYPDRGASYETFTNEDMLEMESLGPIGPLAPGATIEHTERWSLVGGVGAVSNEADIERLVVPRVPTR